MANLTGKAVSELPAASSVDDADLFVLSASGASKKATAETVRDSFAKLRTFSAVGQIGLTYGSATIAATYAAMPNNSIGVFPPASFASGELPVTGTVVVTRAVSSARGSVMLYGNGETGNVYVKTIAVTGSTGVPSSTWQKVVADSGWQTATLSSSFQVYNNTAGYAPKYRRIGEVVYVTGVVSTTTEITNGAVIFTLPSGYRPSAYSAFICQGSSANRWLLNVGTNGEVNIGRYGTTESVAVPSGTWLPFTIQFVAA